MSLSINPNSTGQVQGYANGRKTSDAKGNVSINTSKKSGVNISISKAGKELSDSAAVNHNKISATNNDLIMNDPVIDYFNRVGTIDRIDPDGTIQWDLGSEDPGKADSTIFKNITKEAYSFWSDLAGDPTFLGLKYSDDEIRKQLFDAGIKPGFFSVTVGDRSATQFFSQAKGASAVYSKAQYDDHFSYVTSERYLKQYETGHKFLIAGKAYTLGEDRKLNVPYGEDVYDMKSASE